MDISTTWWVIAGLALALILALYVITRLYKHFGDQQSQINDLRSQAHRVATTHGMIAEQFLPLVASYPWDPKNFKFLGSPVDGIAFESDQVIIVEFKTAGSQMSRQQRDIQKLVEEGKVFFREIRLEA